METRWSGQRAQVVQRAETRRKEKWKMGPKQDQWSKGRGFSGWVVGENKNISKRNLISGGETRNILYWRQHQTYSTRNENTLSQTYMFHVCSLKPAQDPWQLIHRCEGCAFNPHGLKHWWKGGKKTRIQLHEPLVNTHTISCINVSFHAVLKKSFKS